MSSGKFLSKYLKFLFFTFIAFTFIFALVGCSSNNSSSSSSSSSSSTSPSATPTPTPSDESINILCPIGAPSLALVGSYQEITSDGKIDLVDGSDQLIAELSKADSEYDIIIAPINVGAKLISAGQTDYRMKAVVTWGNLYYVGTNTDALEGDGELALFGQGAVPEVIVNADKIETSLTPVYYNSAALVQQQLLAGTVQVGMLAEPLASATVAKAKKEGIELSIIKDLQEEYAKQNGNSSSTGYPQAAIFVKEGENFDTLFEEIDNFTNNDYPGLEGDLELIGIDTFKLPSLEITVNSIERQNVHYIPATEVQSEIKDFLALFNIEYSDNMLLNS